MLRRRSLGSDGRYRFDAMVRADVVAGPDETAAPEVSSTYPLMLALILGVPGGGDVAAVVVDSGRDVWASLAVAEELTRLAEQDGGVSGFRVLPAGQEPSNEETAALLVIAADHTPASRLRELRRRLRSQSASAMTLVLVRALEGA
jgi:hypothetical protein